MLIEVLLKTGKNFRFIYNLQGLLSLEVIFMVRNQKDGVECDRAYYSKLDHMTVIMCNKEYKLICANAKYCDECGHYMLKNSASMCTQNNLGNYANYKKETNPKSGCGCGK